MPQHEGVFLLIEEEWRREKRPLGPSTPSCSTHAVSSYNINTRTVRRFEVLPDMRLLCSLVLLLLPSPLVSSLTIVPIQHFASPSSSITGLSINSSHSDDTSQSIGFARLSFNALALLLLPLLCFVGLVGNAFVCVAIATDRRLQNVTNYFLFSLALADLLVCCVVMPLSIVVEVKQGVWTWSFSLCLLYVYADVFLCSASIVHMSVISLDRYLGISQPLKTRNRTKTAIFIKITFVWLITILISSPLAVVALQDPTNVLQANSCMVHNRYYMIYGSTLSFLIPFFIMAITYLRTTALLNKQAMILSHHGSQCGNGLRRSAPPRKLGYSMRRGSAISKDMSSKQSTASFPPIIWQTKNGVNAKRKRNSDEINATRLWKLRNRTSNYLSSIVSRVQRKSSITANQELLSEHKATRVLAVVFVCFFICWTPFFAANFVSGFCGITCSIPSWAGSLFLWLGYVSSTINPLIYTVFNKRFRKAFIRILRGQCCAAYHDPANSYWSRTHTIMPDTYTYSNYDRTMSRDETGRTRLNEFNVLNPSNGKSVAFERREPSSADSSPSSAHNCRPRKESTVSNPTPRIPHSHSSHKSRSVCSKTEEEEEEEAKEEQGGSERGGYREDNPREGSSSSSTDSSPTSSYNTPSSASKVKALIQSSSSSNESPHHFHSSASSDNSIIKRSATNSQLIQSSSRIIPTANMILAEPLLLYKTKSGRYAIANGHERMRGLHGRDESGRVRSASSIRLDTEQEGREVRGDTHSSLPPLSSQHGPHLTLVATTNEGKLVKETFL